MPTTSTAGSRNYGRHSVSQVGIDHERAGHWVDGVATCQYWHGGCAWGFARTNRQRCDELKLRQQAKIDDNERIAIALEGAELGFWEWDIAPTASGFLPAVWRCSASPPTTRRLAPPMPHGKRVFTRRIYRSFWQRCALIKKTRRSDWSASTAFVIDPAFRFGFWIAADGWVTRAGN
ncbi:Uncharacterised protein [Acinetobacter baumannii]|nr:hypothetical protein C6W84_16967 [Acinetobacter baumannii]SSP22298.1 Uncharacterised protein [Acinetobacter baumannii]SSV36140.1 Uncharacterised protein [Acinetobacter baumannii]